MRKPFRILLSAAFFVAVGSVAVAAYLFMQMTAAMQKPLTLEQSITVTLKPGWSIRSIASYLENENLLDDRNYMILWGRLHKQSTRLQAGEYTLSDGDTLANLLQRMVDGDVIQHGITLVEGLDFEQTLAMIHASPYLQHTLDNLPANEIMIKLGHPGIHPEGRFFPDTYFVSAGMKDTELLKRAYTRMEQVLDEEWQQRDQDLPFKKPYEALILASIVEKETAVAEERPLIAGVFINRLKKGMRLQTDPTVIYGIENYDGNIRFRDLRKDTPYNTYTRYGLTPTPIAMPGREAIHAVLHPDKTDKLYFVAYGDGSGRHVFSSTLKDHEKAVDKYQRRKKQD